jgi:hypothetical protein
MARLLFRVFSPTFWVGSERGAKRRVPYSTAMAIGQSPLPVLYKTGCKKSELSNRTFLFSPSHLKVPGKNKINFASQALNTHSPYHLF